MAVYVDDWRQPKRCRSAGCSSAWCSGWSHLFADSRPELDAFADRLGLPAALRRVEASGVRCEVPDGLRLRALHLGAIPVRVGSAGWRSVVRRSRLQVHDAECGFVGRWAA